MKDNADILEWPMHLVGVSDQVTDWLKQAGIPAVPMGPESVLKSAFRWKPKRSSRTSSRRKRCLLFESRDVWSRTRVKGIRKDYIAKIDVSKLMDATAQTVRSNDRRESAGNPRRFRFLQQLKLAVENAGGVWARLSDLPFPYQGIGCLSGKPVSTGDLGTGSPDRPQRLDQIQKRYIAGLPSEISASDLAGLADQSSGRGHGLQSPDLPLLWRADQQDFFAWWRYRNRLEIQVWQTPTHYRVDCRPSHPSFCPVLEIWRGNHIASIPLRAESIIVRKEGLVFLRQPKRNPAGFTADWPDGSSEESPSRLSA